jgi:hypothetical protein
MTVRDSFDRSLADWLATGAGSAAPDYLDETLDALRNLHQRPVWAFPGRWLPSPLVGRRVLVTPLLVILLLLALLYGLGIAGGWLALPLRVPATVPPPFGLAKPGLIALDSGGQIVVASPDGSGSRVLHPSGRLIKDSRQFGATFSRDGARVAYWEVYGWNEADPGSAPAAHLWVAGVDGADAVNRTPDLVITPWPGGPAGSWSPDGSAIVVASGIDTPMYIVSADRRTPPRIVDTGSLAADVPTWSPDGRLIAFQGMERQPDGQLGAPGVYVIRPDGSGLTAVSAGDAGWPEWAPDGQLLYIHDTAPVHDFVEPFASTIELVVAERVGDSWTSRAVVPPSTIAMGTVSNDGTRIAYIRVRPGNVIGDLFVSGIDGSDEQMVSDRPVNVSSPCWSPDDHAIAIVTGPVPPGAVSIGPLGWPDQSLSLFPIDGGTPVEIPVGTLDGIFACSWQRLAP